MTTITLPERLYINYYLSHGKYNGVGMFTNPLIYKETQDDFIDYICNDSDFKEYSSVILSNMCYISYLYLNPFEINNKHQPESYDINKLYKIDHVPSYSEEAMISTNELKTNYPKIYEKLTKGKKVIICWCLHHHDSSYCKENVDCVEFIESRLNKEFYINKLMMKLLIWIMNWKFGTLRNYIPLKLYKPLDVYFWCQELNVEDYENLKSMVSEYVNKYVDEFEYELRPIVEYYKFDDEVINRPELKNYDSLPNKHLPYIFDDIAEYFINNYNEIINHESIEEHQKKVIYVILSHYV